MAVAWEMCSGHGWYQWLVQLLAQPLYMMLQSINMYYLLLCPSVISMFTGLFIALIFQPPSHFGSNLCEVGMDSHT